MKPLEQTLKRWLNPAVFATWTGFMVYLLASQRYVAFLRPEFGLLLALAHFIAMGFMIAALGRTHTTEIDLSAIFRSMVLLVPVLFYITMPSTMLGKQAFKKRFIGNINGTAGQQAPSMFFSEGSKHDPGIALPSEQSDGTGREAPQERTILEIFLTPNALKGQRVVVTGMVMHDEQLKQYFGGMETALYRFLINCCAADALPLAIALDSDQADAFDNDQWVQVDGIFDLQQINGQPVPMVLNAQIKAIEAPAVPYLF